MEENKPVIETGKMVKKKNITTKKVIKASTILIGLGLIIFSTLSNVVLDITSLDLVVWMTSSSILIGIMVFGLLMGESVGEDKQTEKPKGLYQTNYNEYITIRKSIESISIYFSQFYNWHKTKELRNKKFDYLIDHSFDGEWAKELVEHTTKSDLNSLIKKGEHDNTVIINGVSILKVSTEEEIQALKEMYDLKLDTPKYSYFISTFGKENSGGLLEQATYLNKKLKTDKKINRAFKILSSLLISFIWGIATVKEFGEGQQLQAWLNLFSRITAFITAFSSGYSSSIISVKTQAELFENKTALLRLFKHSVEQKIFIPETYEMKVQRLLKEQQEHEIKAEVLDPINIGSMVLDIRRTDE